jgi:LmbE family N-acetylglucosaminyl deacetylase
MINHLLAAAGLLLAILAGGGMVLFARDWFRVVRRSNEATGIYNFTPDTTAEVGIGGGQFTIEENGETSWFLEVEVRSTWWGWIYPPEIDIRCEKSNSLQYLSLGHDGKVCVDLSLLKRVSNEPCTVSISCTRCELASGTGTLLGFTDIPLDGRSLCVVAPHPDDAEIAAFGLYSDETVRSSIVTVTAGDRGRYPLGNPLRDEQGTTRDSLKGEIRAWDSVAIPNLGGVPFDRCYNLGYLDGKLDTLAESTDGPRGQQGHKPVDAYRRGAIGRPTSSGWDALISDLTSVFRRESPDTVVCPHPELDCYGEHQRTTEAVVEAVYRMESEERPSRFLLYTVHNSVNEFFPFGPPQGSVTVPPVAEGPPILASTPFSYRLSDAQIARKQYALEAMHELRRVTLPKWKGRPSAKEALRSIVEAAKQLIGVPTETMCSPRMIDRAARPNELFFVASTEQVIAELRHARP